MRVNRSEREAGHLPLFIAGVSEARTVNSTFSYSWREYKAREQICILHSSLVWPLTLVTILLQLVGLAVSTGYDFVCNETAHNVTRICSHTYLRVFKCH